MASGACCVVLISNLHEETVMKLRAIIATAFVVFSPCSNPLSLAQQSAQTEFIFPFFAVGILRPDDGINPSSFRTELCATNPNPQDARFTFEFFANSGQLLTRTGFSVGGDDAVGSLASRKPRMLGFGSDQIQTGWIKVT